MIGPHVTNHIRFYIHLTAMHFMVIHNFSIQYANHN